MSVNLAYALLFSHIFIGGQSVIEHLVSERASEWTREADKRKRQLEKPGQVMCHQLEHHIVHRVTGDQIPRLAQNISLHMMTKQLQAQMFQQKLRIDVTHPKHCVFHSLNALF